MTLETAVKISDIDVRDRLREIDALKVEALKQSFAELGLRTPITVRVNDSRQKDAPRYVLSAGAHRLEAARQLGWNDVPAYVRNENRIDAELWEIDENLARSELSPADRAVFTFRRKELYLQKYPETAHGGDRKSSGQVGHLIDRQERKSFVAATAELSGKSERAVRRDADRGEKICEAALRLLRGTRFDNGTTLDKLKKLPSNVAQIAHVEGLIAEDRRIAAENKQARAHTQKVKHAVRMTIATEIANRGRETAPGKIQRLYPIIYADPPWQFKTRSEITGGEKSAENHYPTMDIDAICRLFKEIGDPATPDAMLYLWVTTPMKAIAIRELLPAWGFEYVSEQIWNKVDIGTGYQVRDQHESLLFAKRGRGFSPLLGEAPPSLYTEKKGLHSVKPAWFAEQIERLYPDVPKLELFCRSPRPGWDAWGYEAAGRAEQ
ncbi:ParB N-terminal domain-containing protein [Brucella sp. 6810]|uniref:MT-A70 family methyltransferase n=1 Tax=Brucella sp. 6810 TaxID=2769351 RepID=UPI00165C362E|nr:MT-A70 family methyltransferase [Brucella sp. 6810]QNQ62219.1 ParB N-terminal domain-containing protein [Brucella sp. 6810]